VISFPNAKINIGLHVVSKRADGFHNIETVMLPVPLFDALEVLPAEDKSFCFTQTGLDIAGASDENLCVRVWRMMSRHHGIPAVRIHLHKQIPMGAGLGGGSSNGAFVLKMLNDLLGMGMDIDSLEESSLLIGSDCPFFIRNVPALATGRGEKLTPLSLTLKGLYLLIVMPSFHVPTAKAYQWVTPDSSRPSLSELITLPVARWQDVLMNDFEQEVFARHPDGLRLKQALYEQGAVYAQMTGSGSAFFGIFENLPEFVSFPDVRIVYKGML
jgi:4-diphosphocytidyl-2-C-methyl-D-erythritol kinase